MPSLRYRWQAALCRGPPSPILTSAVSCKLLNNLAPPTGQHSTTPTRFSSAGRRMQSSRLQPQRVETTEANLRLRSKGSSATQAALRSNNARGPRSRCDATTAQPPRIWHPQQYNDANLAGMVDYTYAEPNICLRTYNLREDVMRRWYRNLRD